MTDWEIRVRYDVELNNLGVEQPRSTEVDAIRSRILSAVGSAISELLLEIKHGRNAEECE